MLLLLEGNRYEPKRNWDKPVLKLGHEAANLSVGCICPLFSPGWAEEITRTWLLGVYWFPNSLYVSRYSLSWKRKPWGWSAGFTLFSCSLGNPGRALLPEELRWLTRPPRPQILENMCFPAWVRCGEPGVQPANYLVTLSSVILISLSLPATFILWPQCNIWHWRKKTRKKEKNLK